MRTLMVVLASVSLANVAHAEHFRFGRFPTAETVHVEALVQYTHQSDLFTGPLIPYSLGGVEQSYEPTLDYVSGGVTIFYQRWEIDLTQGGKAVDCVTIRHCSWESGTAARARFYFRRTANAAPTDSETISVEPFLALSHTSDIFRGPPLYKNDLPEPTNEFVGIGLSLGFGRWGLDVAQGVKCINCTTSLVTYSKGTHSGTEITFRFYPGRKVR